MSADNFTTLLENYIAGELSAGDKTRLQEMMNEPANQPALEEFVRGVMISDDRQHIDSPLVKARLDTFLDKNIKKQKANVIFIKRFAVAASVAAIMTTGYFLFFNKKEIITPTLARDTRTDIAPGGNKAILTLGNGSTIILDSAHIGKLAEQGNTKITKLNNGELAYDASGKKYSAIIYNTLSTPNGGQYQLELPDGTKVWLNAASSITYPTAFTGNERQVSVTGEAYFEVTKDPRMPFTVSARGMAVQVLGTHFNINAYPDELSSNTTLLEGSVKIIKGNRSEIIKPGERAEVNTEIKIIRSVDLDAAIAWKNGYFQFAGTDLTAIMRQVSRWYDVEIVVENNTEKHFSGIMSRNVNLSNVLKILESNGAHFEVTGKKIIVK